MENQSYKMKSTIKNINKNLCNTMDCCMFTMPNLLIDIANNQLEKIFNYISVVAFNSYCYAIGGFGDLEGSTLSLYKNINSYKIMPNPVITNVTVNNSNCTLLQQIRSSIKLENFNYPLDLDQLYYDRYLIDESFEINVGDLVCQFSIEIHLDKHYCLSDLQVEFIQLYDDTCTPTLLPTSDIRQIESALLHKLESLI